eukprot:CAMPEP_0181098124 /NCGR_PEP_ID=MMETSP1071-20121207/11948_1 /TAXON_ID=35127 /ORGANISM="Thalassiosira sp., Strain NH16" /LENGTH=237 /DNA_ID=CAMNT_0023180677 /DNA_START=835 /DNA_END=1548 /DNA_ORIENTATION=+
MAPIPTVKVCASPASSTNFPSPFNSPTPSNSGSVTIRIRVDSIGTNTNDATAPAIIEDMMNGNAPAEAVGLFIFFVHVFERQHGQRLHDLVYPELERALYPIADERRSQPLHERGRPLLLYDHGRGGKQTPILVGIALHTRLHDVDGRRDPVGDGGAGTAGDEVTVVDAGCDGRSGGGGDGDVRDYDREDGQEAGYPPVGVCAAEVLFGRHACASSFSVYKYLLFGITSSSPMSFRL